MTRYSVTFRVIQQELSIVSSVRLYAGGRNYFYSVFKLEPTFCECSPKAVFQRGEISKLVSLDKIADDTFECIIPWEVMEEVGEFTAGVFGGDRMLTNTVKIRVYEGCICEGEEPLPPTPDWFQTIETELDGVNKSLDDKVTKENGKGLSSNDYTDEEKEKLKNLKTTEELGAVTSVAGKKGDVILSKEDVGLNKVDNTSDEDKPLSKAVREKFEDVQSEIPKSLSQLTNDKGFISSVEADNKVSAHNTDEGSHNDIRLTVQDIANRLNAFLDTDDKTLDQLSEIVEYITANKDLIDSVTTSKVNITDIIDNLVTSASDKPLSAKQGVVLKSLIDELNAAVIMINNSKPYIGDNNHWYEWDAETEKYIDTGVQAEGKDGYTPVKGVDYWTEEDKAEIKNYVDEAILGGEW